MKILIACEFSGIVREAFRRKGHDVWSCDILPTEIPGNHYQCDALSILDKGWDMMIAHPPCTYLTVSANKWLKEQPKRKSGAVVGKQRYGEREKAINFFMQLVNAKIDKICVENPIGCMSSIYKKPTQIIHPYYFGDPVSKATCLWLKNLLPLKYNNIDNLFEKRTTVDPEWHTTKNGKKYPKWSMIDACKYPAGEKRSKFRSKTFQGIAEAMAEQWG